MPTYSPALCSQVVSRPQTNKQNCSSIHSVGGKERRRQVAQLARDILQLRHRGRELFRHLLQQRQEGRMRDYKQGVLHAGSQAHETSREARRAAHRP